VCGKVNRHKVRTWGTENPHATVEHVPEAWSECVFCRLRQVSPRLPSSGETFMHAMAPITETNLERFSNYW
jgi:hypothetical protein